MWLDDEFQDRFRIDAWQPSYMGGALNYSAPRDPYNGLTLNDVLTDEEKREREEARTYSLRDY